MKPAFIAPKGMLDKKPPYGSPCNRCGLCCVASICQLGQKVFSLPAHPGTPCPGLRQAEDQTYYCDVAAHPQDYASGAQRLRNSRNVLRDAALKIIGAGAGCDARFNGEPRDPVIGARFDAIEVSKPVREAKRAWGIK